MLGEALKKYHGNDNDRLQTLKTPYQRLYPITPEPLFSLYMRKVIENDVMPEKEECDVCTEPSFMGTETSLPGFVLSRRENYYSVLFLAKTTVLLISHLMNNILEIIFKTWTCMFTTISGKDFLKTYGMEVFRRSILFSRSPCVLVTESLYLVYTYLVYKS